MIQLKLPTTKTFALVVENDILRVAKEDEAPQGSVTFRQATVAEVEQRNGALQKRKWAETAEGLTWTSEINFDYIARLEVFLTLSGTDITLPDGGMIEFNDSGSKKVVRDRKVFDQWWDCMPLAWARLIHKCCGEVNLDWSDSKSV